MSDHSAANEQQGETQVMGTSRGFESMIHPKEGRVKVLTGPAPPIQTVRSLFGMSDRRKKQSQLTNRGRLI
jgi:hypothetical protein